MNKITAYLSIIFVAIMWGISFLNIRVVSLEIGPLLLPFYRYIFTLITLFIAMILQKESFRLEKKDFMSIVLSAVFGIVIYFYAENSGVYYLNASTASIIIGFIPIIMLLVNTIVNKEKLPIYKKFLIILSIFGVYLVVNDDLSNITGGKILGYITMIIAVFSWVLYSQITNSINKEKYSSLRIAFFQSLIALVLFTPYTIKHYIPFADISLDVWAHIVFLGVICSALCFFLYVYSMDILGTTISSLFINLLPVVTLITSRIFLRETLVISQIIGVILILSILFIISFTDIYKVKSDCSIRNCSLKQSEH